MGLGVDPESLSKTIYEAFTNKNVSLYSVALQTKVSGLSLAPSNILLSGLEFELAIRFSREFALKQLLNSIDRYDMCIIDCSPSLSLLTLNALVASDEVIIPVQTQYYAIEGLKQLLGTIGIVKQRFNSSLKILGILLTFVETRTSLSKQIQQQMRQYFGNMVFDTVIHRTVKLAEAPSAGLPILLYAPKSRGADEYRALAAEITNAVVTA
jgi:chromosome partitioning protein